ncbi:MAG: MATE family efflux transporter [Ignavibacteriaceae bacterium]|nr:MATE family efflux transporter [Ignavibacteriaceae bacterium]
MKLLPKNNYYKTILHVALPAIAGLSTQMVVSLVDTAMVGRLDEATYALAAMGIGVLATWALISFFSSLATGIHVVVARKYGEGDYVSCGITLNNSLLLAVGVGAIVAMIGVFFSYPIAHLFATDEIVGNLASEYLYYRFMGIPFFLISVSFRGFFFGINRTKIFMFSGVITNILNILFNYIFIYGEFGAPRMGLAGAGLGSTLATMIDGFFYTAIIMLPSYRKKFQNLKNFTTNRNIISAILKISLPVSFQNVFILIGFLSFVAITGIIGTLEQAATQAVISVLFISFLPCFGFGIAVQTLVGNNLGAKKSQLAKIYGFETAKVATIYTIILGFIFTILPKYVLLIVTNDQTIINTAAPPLRVAGFAQIFYAVGVVLANGLQAAGRSFYVMKSEVVTNLLIFVPLAYFLGVYFELGLTWAWMALPVYIILYSLIIYIKFNSNDWQTKISIEK